MSDDVFQLKLCQRIYAHLNRFRHIDEYLELRLAKLYAENEHSSSDSRKETEIKDYEAIRFVDRS